MSGGLKRVATWYFRVEGGTPDAKRRARTILSSIVAIQCSWMLFATLALELAPEGRAIPSIVVAAIAGLVSVVAAALTRRGNVDAGGLLLSGSLSVLVACYQLYVGTYTGFLWFLALSVVLGSVSLRPVFILFMWSAVMILKLPVVVMKMSAYLSVSSSVRTWKPSIAAWSAQIGSISVTITRAPCPFRLWQHPLPTSP